MPRVSFRYDAADGLNLFVREAGDPRNPTILLLHGFPSSSHMFRELIPDLADQFHLLAPDYPGFGHSDCPPVTEFTYTFESLSQLIEHWLEQRRIDRFAMYMQDYGGPIGMRIATRHPDWITGLIVQNANFYEDGLQPMFVDLLRPLWEHRCGATEAPVFDLFEPEGTKMQYQTGAGQHATINPDAWRHDQAGLDRPGNKLIQLELQANYHTNIEQYSNWHQYLKAHQPPTLVTWGQGDPLFGVENVRRLESDLADVQTYVLDAGHFALEERNDFIAARIREFFVPRLASEASYSS